MKLTQLPFRSALQKVSRLGPLKHRGVLLRALFCWAIGLGFLLVDDPGKLDMRFKLRGHRPQESPIVLVLISQRDWNNFHTRTHRLLRPTQEIESLTDSFFWNTTTWLELLGRLESFGASAVGVTFYFGETIRTHPLVRDEVAILEHPKVLWAAGVDGSGGILPPKFVNSTGGNTGLSDVRPDKDGVVRRVSLTYQNAQHLSLALANRAQGWPYVLKSSTTPLINFQGPRGQFTSYDFHEVMDGRVPGSAFKDRIVIIGAKDAASHIHMTPVGPMARAELFANVTDNILYSRWIRYFSIGVYAALFATLTLIAVWIIRAYPLAVALIFFIWLATAVAALFAWIFDVHYYWLPVTAPLILLTSIYIVFLSYQVSLNEQRTWILEQERKYLIEVEQLKNNFVSLISHDLKTPIAKIRGIADRLLVKAPEQELAEDLQNMRRASDELNRYIESILQVLRVESKDFKLRQEVADINELCNEIIDQLQPLAKHKNITIEAHLEPMFSIEMDITLIREVIHNLLENAIKYSPPDRRVSITTKEVDDQVIVVVEDRGAGIPKEEQEKIWSKFYRGSQHTLSSKGSGLGLYLVKYFVELHHGKIFLDSQPGHGTRVGFKLPIHEGGDSAQILEV